MLKSALILFTTVFLASSMASAANFCAEVFASDSYRKALILAHLKPLAQEALRDLEAGELDTMAIKQFLVLIEESQTNHGWIQGHFIFNLYLIHRSLSANASGLKSISPELRPRVAMTIRIWSNLLQVYLNLMKWRIQLQDHGGQMGVAVTKLMDRVISATYMTRVQKAQDSEPVDLTTLANVTTDLGKIMPLLTRVNNTLNYILGTGSQITIDITGRPISDLSPLNFANFTSMVNWLLDTHVADPIRFNHSDMRLWNRTIH